MVKADSFLGRAALAARPGRPFRRLTVSPRLARVLIAAGAQPAPSDDEMTVSYPDAAEKPARDVPPPASAAPTAAKLATAADRIEIAITETRQASAVGSGLGRGQLARRKRSSRDANPSKPIRYGLSARVADWRAAGPTAGTVFLGCRRHGRKSCRHR